MRTQRDPSSDLVLGDFRQRLDAAASFYRLAILSLSRERLIRDLDPMHEDLKPIGRPSPARRLAHRIGGQVRRWVFSHGGSADDRCVAGAEPAPPPTIIVIEPEAVSRQDEHTERDLRIKNRSAFDV